MPPPNKRVTFEPSLIFVETPSSLPILDSPSDQDIEMITGVTEPSAKNESNSNLNGVTLQPTIIIYPTVPPETVIIPILCSIIIFPIVAASAICLLRYYNQRARAKDRFRAGFQQGASAMFAMGGRIGATGNVGNTTKPEDRPPGVGLLDTGPQFQYMPELELDTVFEAGQSQDDVSSDNPTSSQPPSDEQPEAVIEDAANPVSKNSEKINSESTKSTENVPTIPPLLPPPPLSGPSLVPPSLAQAKKAMKPLLNVKNSSVIQDNNKDISVEVI